MFATVAMKRYQRSSDKAMAKKHATMNFLLLCKVENDERANGMFFK